MKSIHPVLTFLLPRIQDMLFGAIFIGALIIGPRMLNGDLGRHLTLGKYMVATRNIPTRDLFSFTKPGESRPPYEWLAQVVFYYVYTLLNLDGVVLLTALVLAVTFSLVYSDSVQRSRMPVVAAFLTLLAASASSLDWLTRPQIFSFLFFTIWLQGLEKVRKGEKINLWFFPILMLFWVNTHGGFILGFLTYIAYLAGWILENWRKQANNAAGWNLMIVGASAAIVSIITPDLWRNWQGVLNNNSLFVLSHTSETMPPNLKLLGTLPFTIILLFVSILLILRWKLIPGSQIFLLVGFAFVSLIMARNIPFFAIVAAPILAENISLKLKGISLWTIFEEQISKIDSGLRGYTLPIFVLMLATGLFSYYQIDAHSAFNQFNQQELPVKAADWMEGYSQAGNMFTDFNWGGYLLFKLWPGNKVFIDSQSDFYGEELTREYAALINGQGNWDKVFNQYNVTLIIIPANSGLAEAARAATDWQITYQDPLAVIFVRK